jgi:hypothetical protein
MQAFRSTDPAEWRKEWNKGEENFLPRFFGFAEPFAP